MLPNSVGQYTENSGYQGIEINTASFLQYWNTVIGKFIVIFIVKMYLWPFTYYVLVREISHKI